MRDNSSRARWYFVPGDYRHPRGRVPTDPGDRGARDRCRHTWSPNLAFLPATCWNAVGAGPCKRLPDWWTCSRPCRPDHAALATCSRGLK